MSERSAIERRMIDVLEGGSVPSAGNFGGLDHVLDAADTLDGSAFVPEFLELVLNEGGHDDDRVHSFVVHVTRRPRDDMAMAMVVDVVARVGPLSETTQAACFSNWLGIATDRGLSVSMRTAALRGAFLVKGVDGRRAARLAGEVAMTDRDDDPSYVAHAVRIAGFLVEEASQPGLLSFMSDILSLDGASDEAAFQMGMNAMHDAFTARDEAAARAGLACARGHFDQAGNRGSRSDARLLSLAIGLLLDFGAGREGDHARHVSELSFEAFAHAEYAGSSNAFPGRSNATEVASWATLGMRLGSLSPNLGDAAWLDARRIIEEELLVVYISSRSIFRRGSDGMLEWLVRPRVERELRSSAGQRHQVGLLATMGLDDPELHDAAATLLRRVDDGASASPNTGDPGALLPDGGAASGCDPVVATFFSDAIALEAAHVSPQLEEALRTIQHAFGQVSSYAMDKRVRSVVNGVVLKTMFFLQSRLDATVGQDETVAYLYRRPPQADPVERDLQQDYLRHMRTSNLGSGDERRGVAGGRTDLMHDVNGIRFVTEIKRETRDASFEALLSAYGDQALMYTVGNVPLAMLMVLDLTTRDGRPDHISKLYRSFVGDLCRDGVTRALLVIKVPGRRIQPNAASRSARHRRGAV